VQGHTEVLVLLYSKLPSEQCYPEASYIIKFVHVLLCKDLHKYITVFVLQYKLMLPAALILLSWLSSIQ
jgi:hypothetical protein